MFPTNIGNELKLTYRSTEDDIVEDFYVPVLSQSVRYDRSVGYFSSNILVSYIEGLEKFINNYGKMRLLISPFVSSEDGQAIIDAVDPKSKVEENLKELFSSYHLHGEKSETAAKIFSQLIRENYLEVRIVIPNNFMGLFHEKTSLFYDEFENIIATTGSNNETKNAIKFNFETFNTFRSWMNGQEQYVEDCQRNFENAWNSELKRYHTVSIKDITHDDLSKYYESDSDISELYKKLHDFSKNKKSEESTKISDIKMNLDFTPYDYQIKAANKWVEQKKGIISFATGTGKTKTAILAMHKLLDREGPQVFVVLVPDKTLVHQWSKELTTYWGNIVLCFSENSEWQTILLKKIKFWGVSPEKPLFIISTIATFFGQKMKKQIGKLNNNYILIADECHRLGTQNSLSQLPSVEYRLGLSATPEIYMSEENTKALYNYFNGVIAEYSLEKAIDNKKLTEYEYYPIQIQLTEDEMTKYKKITHEILKLMPSNEDEKNFVGLPIEVQMKLFQRARIIYGAKDKLKKLSGLLDDLKKSKHMLIYCGATSISESTDNNDIDQKNEKTSLKQIESVNKLLSQKGIVASQYTKDETGKERLDRIDSFKDGTISTLVAIKALDEGVDIPEISTGIILASSGNPREFVQRRGRMLRTAPGKEIAIIYDMVVIGYDDDYAGINRSELIRVQEFTKAAKNRRLIEEDYKELFNKYLEEDINGER